MEKDSQILLGSRITNIQGNKPQTLSNILRSQKSIDLIPFSNKFSLRQIIKHRLPQFLQTQKSQTFVKIDDNLDFSSKNKKETLLEV